MSDNRPIAVDLFSGCGGLTQGLKDAGFRVVGAVDVDALSVETYEGNHQDVEVWEADIRELEVSEISEDLKLGPGDLDLLAGCPPCQGYSTLRTHNRVKSVEDERNDLIFEFSRFVEGLRPKTVMLENVRGLAADKRLTRFCRALDRLGYQWRYQVLNAADYGVPQRRRRLIVLASTCGPVAFAEPVATRRTVRQAIGALPKADESGDPLHNHGERRSPRVAAFIRKVPKDGGSRTDLPEDEQLQCHREFDGFKDVYGRMAWDEVAPTITSGCVNPSKGRFLHPDEDRAITLREAALLQSFPPDYTFPVDGGKFPVARLIGNAFPPEFARHHAASLSDYLTKL